MTTPTDPSTATYFNSVREAKWVAALWVINLTWTVGYCFLKGYQHTPESWPVRWGLASPWDPTNFRHIAGFPTWILFGVVVPWIVMLILTTLFATFIMRDDDLGRERDEEGTHGH